MSMIKVNTERSLWIASSVTQRKAEEVLRKNAGVEALKLFLLQPLISSTKRSWRPMTVGCIRRCLLQDAQRKMRNGIVDIKVFSAAPPVTAVVLISHYPSTD